MGNTESVDEKSKRLNRELEEAARTGAIANIRALLAAKADINTRNKFNQTTPLADACLRGALTISELLIEEGADINAGSPLVNATQSGCFEIVKLLIDAKASINSRDAHGDSALSHASSRYSSFPDELAGNDSIFELLVAHSANINHMNQFGQTPLHMSAFATSIGAARRLCQLGADVNLQSREGDTALIIASRGTLPKSVPMVQLLVEEFGADVHIKNKIGNTALSVCHYEDTRWAGMEGFGVIAVLLRANADVNSTGEFGHTPLMKAVQKKNVPLCEYLLECGADVDACDEAQSTALISATILQSLELVRLLCAHGADADVVSKYGQTARSCASAAGSSDIVQFLDEYAEAGGGKLGPKSATKTE